MQWLRGWVSARNVHEEYINLEKYIDQSNACTQCNAGQLICTHKNISFVKKIQLFCIPTTIRPYTLIVVISFIIYFNAAYTNIPYLIQIFKIIRISTDPHWATVIL